MADQKKTYPPGTTLSDWYVFHDSTPRLKSPLKVRRRIDHPDGRVGFERYPAKKYQQFAGDEVALRRFVVRLNGRDPDEDRAKARYAYQTAFLNPELLQEYMEGLKSQIPSEHGAKAMYGYLERYCLRWFVTKMKLANPLDWHQSQDLWARYLLNKPGDALEEHLRIFEEGECMSSKVLREIVHESNRLLKFLHRKRPTEILPLELKPFSRHMLKDNEARRKLMCELRETKYIRPAHRELLFKTMKDRNIPWRFAAILSYSYGLRRNESLGQRTGDIRLKHLEVEAQLDHFETETDRDAENKGEVLEVHHKPVKDKEKRLVPHWLLSGTEAYYLIEKIQEFAIHPDTLTTKFRGLTEELFGEDGRYTYHDLRRTWITDMLAAGHTSEEVRLAAGHANVDTTYRHYVKDTRQLDGDVFVPPKIRPIPDF